MAMPKPVFKTHVAANKYKKMEYFMRKFDIVVADKQYSEVKRTQNDKHFWDLKFEILRPEIFGIWFFWRIEIF
jgi:hypothetical protein